MDPAHLPMTGEEDYRTPISEAEQYYAALKMLKVDSVLVRAPREPRGVSRRPAGSISIARSHSAEEK